MVATDVTADRARAVGAPMPTSSPRPVPRATYRLQFNADFRFREAARIVPYLARLGVSHVYASPLTTARPGSCHGYDVIDHARLDPALGPPEDFASFVCALRAANLALVLDVVPNHTGIGPDNPFWVDVLEWGRASPFADWFDIDWNPEAPGLAGRVLVPVLEDQIGIVLTRGGIGLVFDPASATIAVEAPGGQRLPLRPEDTATVLAPSRGSDVRLERIADGFAGLPDAAAARRERVADLRCRLARLYVEDVDVAASIETALGRFRGRPGDAASWRTLGALLDRQHWRLAHFQVASDDINYRRFFTINDLAGLRVERSEVFDHVHRLAFDLVDEGIVEGLRIDHVDGLVDPAGYCRQVRAAAPRPVWLVVEKILAAGETLPAAWEVDGTTGYEAAALLTGLLVDPFGLARLSALHGRVDRLSARFRDVTRQSRLLILDEELASELNRLGRMAAAIAASNTYTADHTRSSLTRGLRAVIAAFPVYRTYVDSDGASASDRRALDTAFAEARNRTRGLDPSVFDLLYDLMTTDAVARAGSGFSPQAVIRFAMRVQQVTGPVMAKGVEDTALYRFQRLLALNEVGAEPDGEGVATAAFHERAVRILRHAPATMLSTSTHDTKRGEDARARLAALCGLSDEWEAKLVEWLAVVEATAGSVVGANEALMILQQLTGSLPAGIDRDDDRALAAFRSRLQASIRKSLREAKMSTGWSRPDETYEAAVASVVDRALDPSKDGFLARFLPFHRRVDANGRRFGLLQTALKLTLPGVPDIYQGADLEDLSMVDPDNRRPVDFAMREALLAEVEAIPVRDLAIRPDGAGKLALVARLLGLRRRLPELFHAGTYEPITDATTERLVAFVRRHADTTLVVAGVRFTTPAIRGTLALPAVPGRWTDVLSGEPHNERDGIDLAALDGPLPVAVLLAEPNRRELWS